MNLERERVKTFTTGSRVSTRYPAQKVNKLYLYFRIGVIIVYKLILQIKRRVNI